MPFTLKITPDFSDYYIYGLSTFLKDYKLCWHLNKSMQINMEHLPGLLVDGLTSRTYSLFAHREVSELTDVILLSNFDQHIPWFSKAAHFHYFFIITGNPLSSQLKYFEKSLKKIPQMLLVTKLNSAEKKLVHPLLTDLELHLTQTARKEKENLKAKQSDRPDGI